MHRFCLERHLPLGIEIAVKLPPRFDAIVDFDATDLDHPVAADRVQPGGLGVEDDLPHVENYRLEPIPRQARMSRTWRSVVDRSAPVSTTKSARRRFSSSGIWRARTDSSLAGLMPMRCSTRARWTSAGAEVTMTLSNSFSPSVSNSRGISNTRAGASA